MEPSPFNMRSIRSEQLPNERLPAVQLWGKTPPAEPQAPALGRCPVCGEIIELNLAGYIRPHWNDPCPCHGFLVMCHGTSQLPHEEVTAP